VKLHVRGVPTYVITIPQRHGQTDGQRNCSSNTALCIASRGKERLGYF